MLEHESYRPLAGCVVRDIGIVKPDFAARIWIGSLQTRDDSQQRRLARTCRKLAKDPYDFLRRTLCSTTPVPLYTRDAER